MPVTIVTDEILLNGKIQADNAVDTNIARVEVSSYEGGAYVEIRADDPEDGNNGVAVLVSTSGYVSYDANTYHRFTVGPQEMMRLTDTELNLTQYPYLAVRLPYGDSTDRGEVATVSGAIWINTETSSLDLYYGGSWETLIGGSGLPSGGDSGQYLGIDLSTGDPEWQAVTSVGDTGEETFIFGDSAIYIDTPNQDAAVEINGGGFYVSISSNDIYINGGNSFATISSTDGVIIEGPVDGSSEGVGVVLNVDGQTGLSLTQTPSQPGPLLNAWVPLQLSQIDPSFNLASDYPAGTIAYDMVANVPKWSDGSTWQAF